MIPVIDYPKLHSPFLRANVNGRYIVKPEIAPGFEWIFEPGVRAVDKLHGTNICVTIKDGSLYSIDNRATRVMAADNIPTKGIASKLLMGVLYAFNRGWIEGDGSYYGELIGPDINGNLHQTDHYIFVPFDYLHSKCHWKSWISNKYPKNFDSISEWFKEIHSLFSDRVLKKNVLAEGLVFYHPDGRKAKLRRSMFPWYQEEEHG